MKKREKEQMDEDYEGYLEWIDIARKIHLDEDFSPNRQRETIKPRA